MAILAECPICHTKQNVKNKRCKGKIKGNGHVMPCFADLDKMKRSKKIKYWISYYLPGGKQRREVIGYSIEEARDAEGKRRVQKRENTIFDIKPDTRMRFSELKEWYLGLEKVKALASYWLVELSLNKFNSEFGNFIVSQIKPADLENYQAKRKAEGKADATIDQEIGAAKTTIFKAFDNGQVSGDTLKNFKAVKKLLRGQSNARNRVLSRTEFESLMSKATRHLKGILAMGYYTGMREGEILKLRWDKIDLREGLIRLEASDTKDREPRLIPICDELMEVLKAIPRNIREPHVFLYRGKPIRDLRASLRKACEGAVIPYGRFKKGGFVFHDLRHTFNTYMRKAGVPESVIMEITGHATRAMFDRYNTVDIEDTRKAMEQFQGYLQSSDQTSDQTAENE
jgi:integrase